MRGSGRSRAERHRAVVEDIRSRLQARMYLGLLRPGDRVLTARQQAQRMGVDPRVVMAAYQDLEREGLVVRRERIGVFLAETAHVPGAPEERLAEWVVDVLQQGLARGVRVPELPGLFGRAATTVQVRAVCIECNADQLHALREELTEDYGFVTESMELEQALRPSRRERMALLEADLLVTTSWHAREVAELASALGRAHAAVDINPEWGREITDLLAEGPVQVVATDARFAGKMRALFQRAQGAANLHFTILGRDDPAAIPADAAVVVTRRARQRFDPSGLGRVLPELRAFSPESARALLRQLVLVNTAKGG